MNKDKKDIGKIVKVSGPLVVATGLPAAKIYDVVYVSEEKLVGEIIELRDELVFIQVYEETSGLGPGEPVYGSAHSMNVELGPGLLTSFYDGIQRPLQAIAEKAGVFITRGIAVPGLNPETKWKFKPLVKVGQKVRTGDVLGSVQETKLIEHRIMVPSEITEATVEKIAAGEFTVKDTVA